MRNFNHAMHEYTCSASRQIASSSMLQQYVLFFLFKKKNRQKSSQFNLPERAPPPFPLHGHAVEISSVWRRKIALSAARECMLRGVINSQNLFKYFQQSRGAELCSVLLVFFLFLFSPPLPSPPPFSFSGTTTSSVRSIRSTRHCVPPASRYDCGTLQSFKLRYPKQCEINQCEATYICASTPHELFCMLNNGLHILCRCSYAGCEHISARKLIGESSAKEWESTIVVNKTTIT